jgi:hypothetical protein
VEVVKKMVLLLISILIVPILSHALLPTTAHIGLFADEEHSNWCVSGEVIFEVEMWVWLRPSERGMICVDFLISYPTNVVQSRMILNINRCSILPVVECGYGYGAICYFECKRDWVWIARQTLYVERPNETIVEIIPRYEGGVIKVLSCDEGHPVEPVIKLTNLYINYDPEGPECLGTSTNNSSWGAIKSLYR